MAKYSNLTLIEVQKLAQDIGKKVAKNGAVIGLTGNLGSGKTTFAQAMSKTLGIKTLKSPTFIVSSRYKLKDRFLYHLDFYRLEHSKQLGPLGLEEMRSGKNIVVIEWVEKFPQIMRNCDILISLKVNKGNNRDVTIKFN